MLLTFALSCFAFETATAQTVQEGQSNTLPTPVQITPEHEQRAKELVAQMTLGEKIDYIAGVKSFLLRPVERLGIPAFRLADGPQGIRNNTQSTLYPCGILTAATWNRELELELGRGLGRDAKARGISVLLGPGVNIYRAPMCGRNYEYFGEDPYLAGETGKYYILGVQAEGVMATVKHFAANNQLEQSRHSVSSDVDERTLNEIYFPAFRKAVQEAGVGSVMDSYNLIWGVHSTENGWLNNEVLRRQWGFNGIVMSDWTSVYSTSGAANGGLDLECPVGVYFTRAKLMPLIQTGVVTEKTIDEKVQHILQTFIAFGLMDREHQDKTIALDNADSKATALELARHGVVLLKNEAKNLPLASGKVLVMGPNADLISTGGGSGFVTPYSTVSVYDGLKALRGDKNVLLLSDDKLYEDLSSDIFTDNTFTHKGFRAEYFSNIRFEGEAFKTAVEQKIDYDWKEGAPFAGMPNDHFSARWSGIYVAPRDGQVRVQMSGDDGYRLLVDGVVVGGDWGNHALSMRSVFFQVEKGRKYDLRFEYFENVGGASAKCVAGLMNEALLAAQLKEAREVVFCAGFDSSTEGEGFDRPFALPKEQTDLINSVSARHGKVTVVINAGGGVDFNGWSDGVESILMAWHPGQEGGRAIAEILTGKIAPSGKLPISIENKWEDNPVYNSYYDTNKRVTYTEGIFVGYRGYDRSGKTPRYPFGYGLSYTTFRYGDLQVQEVGENSVEVSFDVTNTGKTDAWETAQVYVGDVESSVVRPEKELKGYEKVFLKKGETRRVTIALKADAFAYYDAETRNFVVEPGEFVISAGPSSAELPLKKTIKL